MSEFSREQTMDNLSGYEREKIDETIYEAQRLVQQLITAKSMLTSAGADGVRINPGDVATPLLGNGKIRESLNAGSSIGDSIHAEVDSTVGRDKYDSYILGAQDALRVYYQARLDELQ